MRFAPLLVLLAVLVGLSLSAPGPGVPVNGGAGTVPPCPVRVMSFNIRYGTAADGQNSWVFRRDLLVRTITEFDPDLLGTQETLAFQRDHLAQELAGYGVVGVGRDDGKVAGEMAALYYRLTRWSELAHGHFWLSTTPKIPGSKGWDAALPRLATWVKLRDLTHPGGPPTLFLNTHFDHRGPVAREHSARLICDQLAELGVGCRIVVTGDFNAGVNSSAYATLFATRSPGQAPTLIDTYRTRHSPSAEEGTFQAFDATKRSGNRIDWIAASPDWHITAAAINHTTANHRAPSDHWPVTAVLAARRGP